MARYIATALHRAIEMAPDEPFLRHCATLPHYVIDPSLIDLLSRSDVEASIRAMIEAEIMRLPYAELLIEMQHGDQSRTLVVIEEAAGSLRARVAAIRPEVVEVDPAYVAVSFDAVKGMLAEAESRNTHPSWATAAGLAVGIGLLMLNIQGVEKEIIEPSRLNKQRSAKGKAAIPRHTLMRIGHAYDQNGSRVGLGAGRTMPVHMRAGHARRQHYGEGNELVRMVFIPPVIVNFRPGQAPAIPRRILAA